MEEESFIGAFGDVPTDLAGDYSQLYIFRAEDFGAWCRRVRNAHEREVDGGVAGMTDAQLADHGLCRIGSAAMWDEVRDMTDRELSEEHGLVRKSKEHVVSHATVEVTPHIDWSRMADELDEFVEIVRGIAGGVE